MSCLFFPSVFDFDVIQYSIFVLSIVYMVLKEFTEEEISPLCKILPFHSIPVYTTQKQVSRSMGDELKSEWGISNAFITVVLHSFETYSPLFLVSKTNDKLLNWMCTKQIHWVSDFNMSWVACQESSRAGKWQSEGYCTTYLEHPTADALARHTYDLILFFNPIQLMERNNIQEVTKNRG